MIENEVTVYSPLTKQHEILFNKLREEVKDLLSQNPKEITSYEVGKSFGAWVESMRVKINDKVIISIRIERE